MRIFQMFGDESGIPSEQFQSIAIVSGEDKNINKIRKELYEIIKKMELRS